MARLLRMPEVAANAVDAVLQDWVVPDDTPFAARAPIATVETDKAVVDVEAESPGVILHRLVARGVRVEVGDPIAVLGAVDEQVDDLLALLAELGVAPSVSEHAEDLTPSVGELAGDLVLPDEEPPAAGEPPAGRKFASPLARRLAREAGLDIEDLPGSGPGGRVVRRDIDSATAERGVPEPVEPVEPVEPAAPRAATRQAAVWTEPPAEPPAPAERRAPAAPPATSPTSPAASPTSPSTSPTSPSTSPTSPSASPTNPAAGPTSPTSPTAPPSSPARGYTDIPHSRIRRGTAGRLTESKRTVPHFSLRACIPADRLLKLRDRLAKAGHRVSITALLVKAAARAHTIVPELNVVWTPDAVRAFDSVDIGVAVATTRGLLNPVLRGVDRRSVTDVADGLSELATKAEAGTLRQADLNGGTLTVTNLGMFGTEEFTAIINPPQSAILAVGAARSEPVVRHGRLAVGTVIRVTLSVDHRPVDGATAARWLDAFAETVAEPVRILV